MWVAAMGRPDITHAVRDVAKRMHAPTETQRKTILRILRYLKHPSTTHDATYKATGDQDPHEFADADYARDLNDRRSVSRGAVMFGAAVVSSLSRGQTYVVMSSTEAEYVALRHVVKDFEFVWVILNFLEPHLESRILIREDNQGAICVATNHLRSARSRQIHIPRHHIRHQVKAARVEVDYDGMDAQHTYILT